MDQTEVNMFQIVVLFFIGIFVANCSSLSLRVNSTPPEAEVVLHTSNGAQKLGVTPLQINDDQLRSLPEGFTLEVSKADFMQQRIMIEKRALSARGEVSVKLQEISKAELKLNDPDVKATIESIARQVAQIQSSLIKKEYIQAEVLTRNMLNTYPYFSVGWNLLGNNFYLQGKIMDSINAYQKALTLEPENVETRVILDRLTRQPASPSTSSGGL
jgi:tetratricopeptide (TPR) repeat protein